MKNNKKKKQSKNTKKNSMIIVGIVAILLLISGGTYAYWQWQSTNNIVLNYTVTGGSFQIDCNQNSSTFNKMAPIANCYAETYYTDNNDGTTEGSFTQTTTNTGKHTGVMNCKLTAINDTASEMTAYLVLKAKLTASASVTQTDAAHLHFAISEVASSATSTYSHNNCVASPVTNGLYGTGNLKLLGGTNYKKDTNIHTLSDTSSTNTTAGRTTAAPTGALLDITYSIPNNSTVTKYIQVYTWLDSSYTGPITYGETVTDPMQNATLTVTFASSTNAGNPSILGSRIEQVTS